MDGSGYDGERSREQLLVTARSMGIEHPEEMTRAELMTAMEVRRGQEATKPQSSRSGSWLNIARQLLAAVVEQGLNMPDAAALIRGETKLNQPPKPQPPLATVTLARIYAAQGHVVRAMSVLTELLKSEPDHPAALALRAELQQKPATGEAGRRRAAAMPHKDPPRDQPSEQPKNDPLPTEPGVVTVTPTASAQAASALAASAPAASAPTVSSPAVDTLVALCRDGEVLQFAWELSAQSQAGLVEGTAIEIEWTTFAPAWSGPIRRVSHIAVRGAVGSAPAPERTRAALISAVLGLRLGHKLVPLTTMSVVEAALDEKEPVRVITARSQGVQAAQGLAQRFRLSVATARP